MVKSWVNNKVLYGLVIFIFIVALRGITVQGKEIKTILIDPGHGGMDGGAKSKNGTIEKNINLEISKELKNLLEKEGYKVYLTREEDVSLDEIKGSVKKKKVDDLNRRCEMKKETNCDMFLSIHLNMYSDSRSKGAQVWYSDFPKSRELAEALHESFRANLDKSNARLPKSAGRQYKILRDKYENPSVIVECGFLSNPKEEALLKTTEYQQKIAESIAKGIKTYYDREKE